MRSFVVFFQGKEGSSALVRQLDRFDNVSVVCQSERKAWAWEPFDVNAAGAMTLVDRRRCLELIFNKESLDLSALNRIYLKTATSSLDWFDKSGAVGFKMRFRSPWYKRWLYRRALLTLFARHRVLVLLLVRQDLLRWALSIYHGDGAGRPGALQFKLAYGQIKREDIDSIEVDCERLAKEIARCRQKLADKRAVARHLSRYGVDVQILRYEDFESDRGAYMRKLCAKLELDVSDSAMRTALDAGPFFEKVHAYDISTFVSNHQQVLDRVGECYEAW